MKDYFYACFDEETIKRTYRDLVKVHHPDLGGDLATMQEINSQYESKMRSVYRKKENSTADTVKFWTERETEMMSVLAQFLKLEGIQVEIIGVWLWLTGETKPVKETLKEYGCRFSGQKKAWYWRSKEHKFRRRNAPSKDLDGLRATWGSSGKFAGKEKDKRPALMSS